MSPSEPLANTALAVDGAPDACAASTTKLLRKWSMNRVRLIEIILHASQEEKVANCSFYVRICECCNAVEALTVCQVLFTL